MYKMNEYTKSWGLYTGRSVVFLRIISVFQILTELSMEEQKEENTLNGIIWEIINYVGE